MREKHKTLRIKLPVHRIISCQMTTDCALFILPPHLSPAETLNTMLAMQGACDSVHAGGRRMVCLDLSGILSCSSFSSEERLAWSTWGSQACARLRQGSWGLTSSCDLAPGTLQCLLTPAPPPYSPGGTSWLAVRYFLSENMAVQNLIMMLMSSRSLFSP